MSQIPLALLPPRPELESAVRAALAKVIDPELRRPITELGMVKNVTVDADAGVHVEVYLTTAACPKKTEISERVSHAVADVPGTGAVKVSLDVMNDEQRTELRKQLRGDVARAGHPVRPAGLADPRVRGRLRQGRRRQVQRHGQPGRRAWPRAGCRSACSTPTSTATRSRG